MVKLIKDGRQYNEIETEYIIDRLEADSRMTVYDISDGEHTVERRVFICRIDTNPARLGTVYVKLLDAEGKPVGEERELHSGYYISGCEYAQLTI